MVRCSFGALLAAAMIAQALLTAHKHGIDVKIVLDKSQATATYSSATLLANVGIPVRIDQQYAIMHDKFMVIDDETVETGSFNFTQSASNMNAENVIVLHDAAVAKRYAQEWDKLWAESVEMKARY
jgi:phosphatidylserine/phosphatidylglycerophosphate/cardiolipin synthase-like enzyme